MRDVEGIGRGLDALRAARKPVLICAPEGRSEAALRSIVAHTGALAGDTALRDAWLRGHGVVLVEDPVTMFEAAVLLSHATKVRDRRRGGGAAVRAARARCSPRPRAPRACRCPTSPARTRTALRKALPSFASQNNPLDVTGQAAVETRMFEDALDGARAPIPRVGVVAFDAFPPRLAGEAPWADAVLATRGRAAAPTGVVFASVCMSPLAYGDEARAFTRRWSALPFLQGHRAAAGAIRALLEHQSRAASASTTIARRAREPRGRPPAAPRAGRGPVDEAVAAGILHLYGVRRPQEAVVAHPRGRRRRGRARSAAASR